MISLEEIKQQAKQGDYMRVAELCKCSVKTVHAVVDEQRSDNHSIKLAFSSIFYHRENLLSSLTYLRERTFEHHDIEPTIPPERAAEIHHSLEKVWFDYLKSAPETETHLFKHTVHDIQHLLKFLEKKATNNRQ